MNNIHDDRFFVAQFAKQVKEFRGQYGRKGQVGGSSANPTSDATPSSVANGKPTMGYDPQNMPDAVFEPRAVKVAAQHGYDIPKYQDIGVFEKIDPDVDVSVSVTFWSDHAGTRYAGIVTESGENTLNKDDLSLSREMTIEKAFVFADAMYDDALLEYADQSQ